MKPFAMLKSLLGNRTEKESAEAEALVVKRGVLHYGPKMHPEEPGMESRDQRYRLVDPIVPPRPLPHVSRNSLRRIKDPMPIPSECPYCQGDIRLDSNDAIYRGKRYGEWPYIYMCDGECDAYVGLHPNTDIPLGLIADRETRSARKSAKDLFFQWCTLMGFERQRSKAYAILAEAMEMQVSETHFAMFDLADCAKAEAILSNLVAETLQARKELDLPWDDDVPF